MEHSRKEDHGISWIEAKAYKNSEFVLRQFMSQISEDIYEYNKLPRLIRRGHVQLRIRRHNDSMYILQNRSPGTEWMDFMSFRVLMNGCAVIAIDPSGERWRISAEYCEETKSILWVRGDDEGQSFTLRGITRHLLERWIF